MLMKVDLLRSFNVIEAPAATSPVSRAAPQPGVVRHSLVAYGGVFKPPLGPPVGSITRVSANLKFGAFIIPALWPISADDLKHRCTFPSGFGLRLRGLLSRSAWSRPGFLLRRMAEAVREPTGSGLWAETP